MKLTRRRFLATAAAAKPAAPYAARGQTPRDRHNVLFISIDDLNDWIGCLGGHPGAKTPHLDRLASRGALFTRAYCAAPLCNPSRAALMAGIAPSTSGIYDNNQPMRRSPALRDAVTLPQQFMRRGYRVIGGGKIYHGPYPDPQSWHEYFPSQEKNKPADPVPAVRPLNGIPNAAHFDWGPLKNSDEEMGDAQVARWAADQLARRHDKPFFLACGIYRPHLPWYVPEKYYDLHPLAEVRLPEVNANDLDDVPPIGRKFALAQRDHERVLEHDQWRRAVRGYLASISFADAQVGRVLDALAAGPNAKDTTVVLWSDHGWHLGQKLHWRKFALWEEATRNVLMISSPGTTRAGARCGRTVNLLDIYPTLMDLFRFEKSPSLQGASLMPLLRDPSAAWSRPAVTTYLRGNHSVRDERWRYIRYNDGSEELYDHTADPLEWTNLAANSEHAGVKRSLARWLPQSDAPESVRERGVAEDA